MIVRYARSDDLADVAAVFSSCLDGHKNFGPDFVKETLAKYSVNRLKALIASGCVIVAEENGRVVGLTIFQVAAGTFYVSWVCIDPSFKSPTFGARFCKFVIGFAQSTGAHKIWAVTADGSSVCRFLTREGCRLAGTMVKHWNKIDISYWELVFEDMPEEQLARVKRYTSLLDSNLDRPAPEPAAPARAAASVASFPSNIRVGASHSARFHRSYRGAARSAPPSHGIVSLASTAGASVANSVAS